MVSLYVLVITVVMFYRILKNASQMQRETYNLVNSRKKSFFDEAYLSNRAKKIFNFKRKENYYTILVLNAIIGYTILITGIVISIIMLFVPYGSEGILVYMCFAIYIIEYVIWVIVGAIWLILTLMTMLSGRKK